MRAELKLRAGTNKQAAAFYPANPPDKNCASGAEAKSGEGAEDGFF